MLKAVARFGDSTTTGGKVFAVSAKLSDNGRRLALTGEEASCGDCSGTYPIIGTGYKMTDRGRCVVVHGDAVLCPCGQNTVLVSGDAKVHIAWDGTTKSPHGSISSSSQPAQALVTFDEKFTLIDASTNAPLTRVEYRLVLNGRVVRTGVTDSGGKTDRIAAERVQGVELQIRNAHV